MNRFAHLGCIPLAATVIVAGAACSAPSDVYVVLDGGAAPDARPTIPDASPGTDASPLEPPDARSTDAAACTPAPERCNGVDDDCDGATDEEASATCAVLHATSVCLFGACVIDECDYGYGNCDGRLDNGCENPLSEPTHCGACGRSCPGAEACLPAGFCEGERFVEVDAGWHHLCARRSTGQVACWGENWTGQLGTGDTLPRLHPVDVPGLVDAIDVSAGQEHSCAVRNGGEVVCWGLNNGRLGDGTTSERHEPTAVVGIDDAVSVEAGDWHSCAIRRDGRVVCWGDNDWGKLGDGTGVDSLVPVDVVGVDDAVELALYSILRSCALRASGQIVCWGHNYQLDDAVAPVPVPGIERAVSLSRGCAVTDGGAVRCFAADLAGATLAGFTVDDVSGVEGAVAVAGDRQRGCALFDTGAVDCWGSPCSLSGIEGATAITAGTTEGRFCAVLADGQTICWAQRGAACDGPAAVTGIRRGSP